MFKKMIFVGLTLLMVGGTTLSLGIDQPAQAATQHVIKWHGKQYRSKYTIKQMRKKYKLRYYKTKDLAHVTWVHNGYWGITNHANIHVGTRGESHARGNLTKKGHFAMFLTYQVNGGNAYSMVYVNLKNGKRYFDRD
ncbi:MAG: hypothetical protein DUD34_15855 [Lactobacillus sp.]|nr:MAG: hypothetical protein DUD34_15855 [Lactobacillus sp.]